jgi:hypothetical protein
MASATAVPVVLPVEKTSKPITPKVLLQENLFRTLADVAPREPRTFTFRQQSPW